MKANEVAKAAKAQSQLLQETLYPQLQESITNNASRLEIATGNAQEIASSAKYAVDVVQQLVKKHQKDFTEELAKLKAESASSQAIGMYNEQVQGQTEKLNAK